MRIFGLDRRSGADRRGEPRDGSGRRALERERDELKIRFVTAETRREWEPIFVELQRVQAQLTLDYERSLRRAGLAA